MKLNKLSTLVMTTLVTMSATVNGYFYQKNLQTELPFITGVATAQANNSMYLYGGNTATALYTSNLYQLSQQGNGYVWSQLPQKNSPTPVSFAQGIVGRNVDSFMILGGYGNSTYTPQQQPQQGNNTSNATTTAAAPLLLQSYNFKTQEWSSILANGPVNRQEFTATYNPSNNKIYIYGGRAQNTILSDFWVMDANNGSISFTSLPSSGYNRYGHSSSLTSDGKLVTIGGIIVSGSTSQRATNNQLSVFDTNTNTWGVVNTTGTIPTTRTSHSAVITSDDKIYIFGGDSGTAARYREYTRGIAVLDTKTWTWTTINAAGIPPSFRSFASGAILDNNKHITFAFGATLSTYYNDINVFDMSANGWISQFNGSNDSGSSSGLSAGVIAGITIGCVVLALIILFVLWKFQKYIRFLVTRIHNDIWKPRSGEPIWAETSRIVFQVFFIFLFALFLVFVIRQAIESPNVVQRIESASAQVDTPDIRFCFDGFPNAPATDPTSTGVSCHTDIGYSCTNFVQQLNMSVFEPQFLDNLGNIQCYLFRSDASFQLASTSGINNGSRLLFSLYGNQNASSGRVHVSFYPKEMDPNVKVYNINDNIPVLLQDNDIVKWQIDQLNDANPNNIYTLEPFTYSSSAYDLINHRYLQDAGWNYVGFLPILNNTPEVTTYVHQEPPNPNYASAYQDIGTFAVSPNSFNIITDREVKMYTLLNALGFVGGIFGLLIAVQAWLFGFRPRSPWGVVHRWSVGDMKKSLLRGLHDKFKTSDNSGIPLVHPVHKRFSVNQPMNGMQNLGLESETQRISRVEERMQVMELLFKAYYVDDEVFRSLDNANKNPPPGYEPSRGPLFPSSEKVDLVAANDLHHRSNTNGNNNSRFSHMFHRNSINSDSTSHHHLTDNQENVHLRDI